MSRPSVRGLRAREIRRGDRAGPFLLLALLAAAFVPSVLQEFDAARLFSAIREAMGRMAAPVQLILVASDLSLAVIPTSEGRTRLETADFPAVGGPATPAERSGFRARLSALEGGFRWPPGPATPPRAPPLPA